MRQLFENAIKNIEQLINIRNKQIEILTECEKTKEATTLQFKLKSYKIWIKLLMGCIKKNIEIKKKEDIQLLKLTSSLEHNLIELFETSNMQDLEKAQLDLTDLEKTRDLPPSHLFSSINSHNSQTSTPTSPTTSISCILNENTNLEEHLNYQNNNFKINNQKKIISQPKLSNKIIDKALEKGNNSVDNRVDNSVNNRVDGVDTSKIEAKPKILMDEIRPSDARGGAIFDLRFVYGVGPKNAEKLVDNGITLEGLLEDWTKWIKADSTNAIIMFSKMSIPKAYTRNQWIQVPEERQRTIQMSNLNKKLEQETKFLSKLNYHQLLGIKWFHDMSQKIPRNEVQSAERILKAAAKHLNPELQITLCGSYRRGRAKSGDIDCLITHPGISTMSELEHYPINILSKYVELLTHLDFLIDHLTDYGRSKYMGFCKIKQSSDNTTTPKKTNIARRIDIRFIPFNSYGTAILYFTGSKLFNTQMRTWALGKGFSLNEYGLKKIKDMKDNNEENLIPCKTEEEVFQILNYPYKTPEQRDI